MLRFAKKPDALFIKILDRVLGEIIFELSEDVLYTDNDFVGNYFSESDIELFGDVETILNEVKRLQVAHKSSKLYMPTDYHFLILDRILYTFCQVYTDNVSILDENYPIKHNGESICELDFGDILETFFWDTDYNLGLSIPKHLKDVLGVNEETINLSNGKPADSNELLLKEYTFESQSENWHTGADGWWDYSEEDEE